MAIKFTPQTMKVLSAVVDAPNSSGADLCRATGIATGTLYPILLRLEKEGALASEWEAGSSSELGRPRRRFYRATTEGLQAARAVAREWQQVIGRLAWI